MCNYPCSLCGGFIAKKSCCKTDMANSFCGGSSGNALPSRRTRVSHTRCAAEGLTASYPPAALVQGVSQWGREQLGCNAIGEDIRAAAGWEGERGGWKGGRGDQVGARATYKTCIQGLSPHQADTVCL